ncbi:MAG: hypothetical protein FD119_2615 [Stygiobacter sp.]|nr:MAG: hypothetical protein FD119_2615 [Stygiobacter sp.]
MSFLRNPSLEEIHHFMIGETHLRGLLDASNLIVWKPSTGDHETALEILKIDRRSILPVTLYDDIIEPSIHLTGTIWSRKDAWQVAEFVENHPAISFLRDRFEVLT